jgi:hypothetical protein
MSTSVEDPVASASSQAGACTDRLLLVEAKHERDDHPDADERPEDPEQKRALPDWKPGKLRALEEDLSTAEGDSTRPAFDHFGAHRSSRVVGHSPLGVVIDAGSLSVPRWPTLVLSHGRSLPLVHGGQHRRKEVRK